MHIELNVIITAIVTAFITWLSSEIYTNMIKPACKKAIFGHKRKAALLRLVKYFAIVMSIILITVFMSLNKLFVLALCVCFSIMVVLFIYDYTLNLLNSIGNDIAKQQDQLKSESLQNKERMSKGIMLDELAKLSNTPQNEERIAQLKEEIQNL